MTNETQFPRITISLINGTYFAEAPGNNGSRRKVELGLDFAKRNPEIVADLLDQGEAIRERNHRIFRDQQTANIHYVSQNHGRLAAKIWGAGNEIFNSRLRKHLSGEAGNAKTETREKKPYDISKTINLGEI